MMLEYLDIYMEKPLPLLATVYQKINMKRIIKQQVRDETIKFLELQNIDKNLWKLGLDKHFSQQDTKSMSQKRKKNYVWLNLN